MVELSIFFLVTLMIIVQNNPLGSVAATSHHRRHHNSNTNINTNINTFRKTRRLYEALARNDVDLPDNKTISGREFQTALVANAAADAAEAATRILAKKMTEKTADAVANAVIRVLTEDATKKADKKEQSEATKSRRQAKLLNQALNRLLARADQNESTDNIAKSIETTSVPTIVGKMLVEQQGFSKLPPWSDTDGSQLSTSPSENSDSSGR